MNKLSTFISVTFQRAGFHRYPEAPQDVSYLQQVHRHLFKFKVSLQVFSEDREIEFHQFLNWLEGLFGPHITLDYKSCEMLADDLALQITQKYPGRLLTIEVFEDGECGSISTYQG